MSERGDGTRVVRAGLPAAEQGEPFLPGPVFAAPFHLQRRARRTPTGVYTRYGNPTWARYERALGELEGGEVVLFASGMAAAAALLLTELEPGARRGDRPRLLPQRPPPRRRRTWSRAAWRCGWRRPPSWPTRVAGRGAALARVARPTRSSRSTTRRRWPTPPARRARSCVVDNTTAGPLLQQRARPGRGRRADERHQAPVGPRRPRARLRGHPRRPSAPQRLRDWRRDAGRDPRAVRGLARPPLAAHARAAARARLRERRCALAELLAGPRRRDRRALPGPARRPRARAGAPPDARLRDRRWPSTSARRERAERFLAAARAGHRGHQLRRRAHHAPSGARAGAATTCRRASSASPPAARTRPTCVADVARALAAA